MTVRFVSAAEAEFAAAAGFYEKADQGLGSRFVDEVLKAIAHLERNPYAGPLIGKRVRKSSLKNFPYKLIYHASAKELVIVAIAHDKRQPSYWRKRLT
jgi:plasmid stabilization system protein ParE